MSVRHRCTPSTTEKAHRRMRLSARHDRSQIAETLDRAWRDQHLEDPSTHRSRQASVCRLQNFRRGRLARIPQLEAFGKPARARQRDFGASCSLRMRRPLPGGWRNALRVAAQSMVNRARGQGMESHYNNNVVTGAEQGFSLSRPIQRSTMASTTSERRRAANFGMNERRLSGLNTDAPNGWYGRKAAPSTLWL